MCEAFGAPNEVRMSIMEDHLCGRDFVQKLNAGCQYDCSQGGEAAEGA